MEKYSNFEFKRLSLVLIHSSGIESEYFSISSNGLNQLRKTQTAFAAFVASIVGEGFYLISINACKNFRLTGHMNSGNASIFESCSRLYENHLSVNEEELRVKTEGKQLVYSKLTKREKEILSLIHNNNKASEISRSINISVQTYRTHRKNIQKKLNVHSTIALEKWCSHFFSNMEKSEQVI